jgi:transposase InsO family protein
LGRPQSATAARREALTARVLHFFEASDGTYGYRRIHVDLAEENTECSPELVRQIMRAESLVACHRPWNGLPRHACRRGSAHEPSLRCDLDVRRQERWVDP